MLDINRVTLLGRAGRDPEIRELRSGETGGVLHALRRREKWTDAKDGQPAEADGVAPRSPSSAARSRWWRRWSPGARRCWSRGGSPGASTSDREGKAQPGRPRLSSPAREGMVNVLSPRPKDDGPGAGAPAGSGGDGQA